ncbi:aminotransferase class I/II-fold pyridoxal phosphate-dependent enzyme [Streptomyces gobiensis]|uniref:aminotransferase class I/II-fold pyridoxal phosphate-dependent enzyme n=1 Tax=Streptomyces gobiensis TaxID=2875706 RepID=UPI001E3E4832|nr:ornithine decarboxylase [Streptomyces gobiensis]UGY94388.1 ornithine decarboxylase [Streptomyces gobiensis]
MSVTARDNRTRDHSIAPVLDALTEHRRGVRHRSFTPPGHKQGAGADPRVIATLGQDVFAADLPSLSGLDDRRMSGRILADAQALMADAVGAEHAFFSTCGSSLAVKSAMLSVAGPYDELLVARNAHKSVVSGLVLAGIEPVWVRPHWDAGYHFSHPPGPQEVAEAFARHPDAKGMVLISPTAYGTCADTRGIAEVCHQQGRPLIVDEAWGAHLPFHPRLPDGAMEAGADVGVTSVHKMGAGLEQASVFHLRGQLVDPSVLRMREELLETASPSVLIYAAIDGWRRQMAERGRELLDDALSLADGLREAVGKLAGLTPLAEELTGPGRAYDRDPLVTVIDVPGLGTSGYAVADWLRAHRQIDVALADHRRIVIQLTHADSQESVLDLTDALIELVKQRGSLPPPAEVRLPSPAGLEQEQVMLPRDAYFGPAEQVPAEDAVGRIAAETASPCPPGLPVLVPGERISRETVDYLTSGVQAGMYVPDTADQTLRTLRVVARR